MANLDEYLKIDRCPHCSVDQPNLKSVSSFNSREDNNKNLRHWKVYLCGRCGGAVTAFSNHEKGEVKEFYPGRNKIDESLPVKVKAYLQQAMDSTFAPAGALMLCASAVDSMLKEKGYKDGSLYNRINRAASEHIITNDIADWAHHLDLKQMISDMQMMKLNYLQFKTQNKQLNLLRPWGRFCSFYLPK
jgi:hypothetical protein